MNKLRFKYSRTTARHGFLFRMTSFLPYRIGRRNDVIMRPYCFYVM
jgi:hypothetical protein